MVMLEAETRTPKDRRNFAAKYHRARRCRVLNGFLRLTRLPTLTFENRKGKEGFLAKVGDEGA